MLSGLSAAQASQVFFCLPIATCVIDRDFRYLAVNKKFADLVAGDVSTLIGASMTGYCPETLVENARRDFTNFEGGSIVRDHEIEYRGGYYLVSVSPVFGPDSRSVIAISVALTDISNRKTFESGLENNNRHLASAYRRAKVLADTDPLTELLNRRGLDKTFEREIRRARRESGPISILIIDIDWFKLYNDRYGHPAGDAAVGAVSSAIRSAIRRPGDSAARYGGEEFLVILPQTDANGAKIVSQAIQNALARLNILHDASPLGQLTVSIGVAGIQKVAGSPDASEIMESLISIADKSLYQAKASGRNTIC